MSCNKYEVLRETVSPDAELVEASKHVAAVLVMHKTFRLRQYLYGSALRYFDVAQYQGERFF